MAKSKNIDCTVFIDLSVTNNLTNCLILFSSKSIPNHIKIAKLFKLRIAVTLLKQSIINRVKTIKKDRQTILFRVDFYMRHYIIWDRFLMRQCDSLL